MRVAAFSYIVRGFSNNLARFIPSRIEHDEIPCSKTKVQPTRLEEPSEFSESISNYSVHEHSGGSRERKLTIRGN